MVKRNLIFGMMLFGLAAQTSVFAASKQTAADGCELLASSVRVAVYQAAQGSFPIRHAGTRKARLSGKAASDAKMPLNCGDTARVTTQAFTAAFSNLGLSVDWGRFPSYDGDFCDSHYLSQCYPNLPRTFGSSDGFKLRLVNDTWKAIDKTVGSFMPYGIASDLSQFAPDILRLSALGAVAVYVDVPDASQPLLKSERRDLY